MIFMGTPPCWSLPVPERADFEPLYARPKGATRFWTTSPGRTRRAALRAQLLRQLDEVLRSEVEGGIGGLSLPSGAELLGAGDVGGFQAVLLGGAQVVWVGGDHHYLVGVEVEQFGRHQVGLGVRLVLADQLGGEDEIPRKTGSLRHVDEQGNVAVREGSDDVAFLQTCQALDGVRPGIEAVPDFVESIFLFLGQTHYADLVQQFFEGGAVEGVEVRPGDLTAAHAVHRGRVSAAPGVGEGGPVHVEILFSTQRLALPDYGRAPVHDRTEHVEDKRSKISHHPILAPMRAASEAISSRGIFRTPLLQPAHAPCWSSYGTPGGSGTTCQWTCAPPWLEPNV